eukprot:5792557-Pleurochrysis_carterae.AAC.1
MAVGELGVVEVNGLAPCLLIAEFVVRPEVDKGEKLPPLGRMRMVGIARVGKGLASRNAVARLTVDGVAVRESVRTLVGVDSSAVLPRLGPRSAEE